jgi:hypothetical protein
MTHEHFQQFGERLHCSSAKTAVGWPDFGLQGLLMPQVFFNAVQNLAPSVKINWWGYRLLHFAS